MMPKPFQFGVRIEQPQDVVNARAVRPAARAVRGTLGNADYSLVAHGKHDLFTFCMCAGGYVIPSVSQDGLLLHERHEPEQARFAVRQQRPGRDGAGRGFGGTDVLAGMRLQETYERRRSRFGRGEYRAPVQRAKDFLAGRRRRRCRDRSYPRGVMPCDLREVLPPVVAEAVAHGLAADGPPLARAVPRRTRCWPARSRAAARRCASTATRDAASRPACRGSTRSAKGPATPAASSAPRWTACAPPGRSSRQLRPALAVIAETIREIVSRTSVFAAVSGVPLSIRVTLPHSPSGDLP